mmetsp:Transcript_15038/g.40478  ORF Transcript_15038/g.40478 Transcript_15038/m.40478 type:complete len:210 (+) Transcript_15038:732-1361(+)
MNLVVAHALDVVYDVLDVPMIHAEEVDVANTEARLLPEIHSSPRLVGKHAVVTPLVDSDEVVHGRHRLHGECSADEVNRLVGQPRHHARHRNRFPATNHEHLGGLVFHACPHVLDCEGSTADDRHLPARAPGVVELAADAVDDVAIEDFLALVGHPLGKGEVAREQAHGRNLHDAAPVLGLQGELVVLVGVLLADNLQLGDVRVHLTVW